MGTYTFEIRTGIKSEENRIHNWVPITKPGGVAEACGFGPATDAFGNMFHGPGVVVSENPFKNGTGSPRQMAMSSDEYQKFMEYKERTRNQEYSIDQGYNADREDGLFL